MVSVGITISTIRLEPVWVVTVGMLLRAVSVGEAMPPS